MTARIYRIIAICGALLGQCFLPAYANDWQKMMDSAEDAEVNRDWRKARQICIGALEAARQLGSHSPEVGVTMAHIADTFAEEGEIKQSEQYFRESLSIAELLQKAHYQNEQLYSALENLAGAYCSKSVVTDRELAYANAAEIREKLFGLGDLNLRRNLNMLLDVYLSNGKYLQAHQVIKKLIEVDKRYKSHPEKKTDQAEQDRFVEGQICEKEGRADEAEKVYREYIAYTIRTGDRHYCRQAYMNLAAILRRTHRAAQAKKVEDEMNIVLKHRSGGAR